jgi:hypothetical protein
VGVVFYLFVAGLLVRFDLVVLVVGIVLGAVDVVVEVLFGLRFLLAQKERRLVVQRFLVVVLLMAVVVVVVVMSLLVADPASQRRCLGVVAGTRRLEGDLAQRTSCQVPASVRRQSI